MLNDPTMIGWLTTGMYVAAATLCGIAARWPARKPLRGAVSHRTDRRRIAAFWWILAAALLLLAINKQLDAQTALTNTLRDMAERGGWYGKRRMWQFIFIVVAAGALIGAVWGVHRLLGRHWREHRLALVGVVLVAGFLLLRIVDIERLGEMTNLPLSANRGRTVVEWAGLACIGAGAWRHAVIVGSSPPIRTAG